MIVVDSSAVVELIGELRSRPGLQSRLVGEALIAPDILPMEAASALRGLNLAGYLDDQAITRAIDDLTQLRINLHASMPLVPRVLALRHNFSAYDASYITLAETFGCPLLTYDERLAKAARKHCAIETISP